LNFGSSSSNLKLPTPKQTNRRHQEEQPTTPHDYFFQPKTAYQKAPNKHPKTQWKNQLQRRPKI
jgi:hypothetical protein